MFSHLKLKFETCREGKRAQIGREKGQTGTHEHELDSNLLGSCQISLPPTLTKQDSCRRSFIMELSTWVTKEVENVREQEKVGDCMPNKWSLNSVTMVMDYKALCDFLSVMNSKTAAALLSSRCGNHLGWELPAHSWMVKSQVSFLFIKETPTKHLSWPTLITNIQGKKLTFCSAQLSWYISKSPHTSSDHVLQQKENCLSDLEIWLCEFGHSPLTFLSGFQVLIFSCRTGTMAWTFSILKSLLALSLYFRHLISYLH